MTFTINTVQCFLSLPQIFKISKMLLVSFGSIKSVLLGLQEMTGRIPARVAALNQASPAAL